jgi:hypothetical protein
VCVQVDTSDEAVRGVLVLDKGTLHWPRQPPPPPKVTAAPATTAITGPDTTVTAVEIDHEEVSVHC